MSVYPCTYCGSKLHPTSHCPKTWEGQGNRNGLKCSYCGATNHDYAACFKRLGKHPKSGVILLDKFK